MRSALRQMLVEAAPRPWVARYRVRRSIDEWQRAGVGFIHVPRAAGTSVEVALYARRLGHVTAAEALEHFPGFADLPTFAIVRDPWSRCHSAYRFAVAGGGDGAAFAARINMPWKYQASAFRSFDAFVEEWLPQQDLSEADPVFRPQAPYVLGADGQPLVSYVGRLDRMDEVRAWVEGVTDRRIRFDQFNSSGAAAAPDPYTAHTRRIVSAIYAADIRAFGFDA